MKRPWSNSFDARYFTFTVSGIAARLKYGDFLLRTTEYEDVRMMIQLYREGITPVRWGNMPN